MAKTMKNVDGITVAQIQDKKLSKTIIGSRHLLRNPPAIAFDVHIVNEAVQSGVEEVTVWDEEAEIRYQTSMDNFCKYKLYVNCGHGPQYAPPIHRWLAVAAKQLPLLEE